MAHLKTGLCVEELPPVLSSMFTWHMEAELSQRAVPVFQNSSVVLLFQPLSVSANGFFAIQLTRGTEKEVMWGLPCHSLCK